jgi:hypothetical protein
MDSNLLAAMIAAAVALAVSFLGWWWGARRENRGRRIERTLIRLEHQIGEFYGPLLGLIEEYLIIEDIEHRIIDAGRAGKLNQDQRAVVRRFIWEVFKTPLHDRCRKILDERLHLIEGGAVHDSVREYLRSSVQQALQYGLWSKKNIATDFLPGYGFPTTFSDEVRNRLGELLKRQERVIHGEEIPKGWSG